MDREKVIKGLRCIKGDTIPCRDCNYADADGYGNYSCKINCATDAIELLKEQQQKTGHWIEKEDYNLDIYYDCSECGESWTTIDGTPWQNGMNYCPHCGSKMKLEQS